MQLPVTDKPTVSSVTTTVGEYLVSQLKAVGVRHVFGVPGNYVLDLMDVIVESSIELVGTFDILPTNKFGGFLATANSWFIDTTY
jgi:indolepyruvate decarboxylase